MVILDSDLCLYVDDFRLIFQHSHVKVIDEQLLYWFVNKNLVLMSAQKHVGGLGITYGDMMIKQISKIAYLGWASGKNMPGEPMGLKLLSSAKLKLLYRKSRFLSTTFRRMLCISLKLPYFDYTNPGDKYKTRL